MTDINKEKANRIELNGDKNIKIFNILMKLTRSECMFVY